MLCDQRDRLFQELRVIVLMNPAARARRVRQRNHQRTTLQGRRHMLPADQLIEWSSREKARERESSDRNDDLRPDDGQLTVEPAGTRSLFVERRDTIAAPARAGAGIAPGHGGDVDARACRLLVDAGFRQPSEERTAGPSGEWLTPDRLDFTGRLPDDHHARRNRQRLNRNDVRVQRASPAGGELGTVLRQALTNGGWHTRKLSSVSRYRIRRPKSRAKQRDSRFRTPIESGNPSLARIPWTT